MEKNYIAKKNFWIGEINKEVKTNDIIKYDDENHLLELNKQTYKVLNIKSAIITGWLDPQDGKLPDLNGSHVGETLDQASERKRKERFSDLAKKEKSDFLIKDEREIGKYNDLSHKDVVSNGGCIEEEKSSEAFIKALGIDLVAGNTKKKFDLVPDDSEVLEKKNNFKKAKVENCENLEGDAVEVSEILSKYSIEKDDSKIVADYITEPAIDKLAEEKFKIFKDHYDPSKKEDSNVCSEWVKYPWQKKAEIINNSDRELLSRLRGIETSDKIIKRIEKRLQTF